MRPITGCSSPRSALARPCRGAPALRLAATGAMRNPALGSRSTGREPLPIWLDMSATSTRQASPSQAATAGARRSACAAIASRGRVSCRRAGTRCSSRSGSAYSRSTAANAARVSLSQRMARLSGLRRMRSMRSARPTSIPACGPPSSLSPLKVTRSAPCAIAWAGVGSAGRPNRVRSVSVPLPRSITKGTPCACASAASSRSSGSAVKPSTR